MAESGSMSRNILTGLFCTSMLLGGCGLKGDLYLEKPDTGSEQSADTPADADVSTDASKSEPTAASIGDVSQPPDENLTPEQSQQPAPLTEQDDLQEGLRQGEADTGDWALENVSPDDEEEDSVDESESVGAPPLP